MNEIFENKLHGESISLDEYKMEYEESIKNPEKFWSQKAKTLEWIRPFKKVLSENFKDNVNISWFEGGAINVSYNCIDRHLEKRGDKTAIIWESDDPSLSSIFLTTRQFFLYKIYHIAWFFYNMH